MKKLNKVAVLFASVALAAPMAVMAAAHGGMPKAIDNWRAADGTVVKSGAGDLCWRNAGWTPATAAPGCDGEIKAPVAVVAPAAPPAAPPPPPVAAAAPVAPAVVPAPVAPVSEKVTFAADAFFDFDKSVLKPDAQAKLTDLVEKTQGVNLEVIIATGHTDATGPTGYNQSLSVRRADAVKNFLISKGIEQNRVYTEGKGETAAVADNATAAGRAKNRRVEVEVVGTRNRPQP